MVAAPPAYPSTLPSESQAYARQFFECARRGDLEAMRAPLDAGLPPNLTNDKGDTLIMLAAYHGHAELVEFLVQKGADPNRVNDRGQSPLTGAVFKNETRVIQALLEGGADPDAGQPSAMEAASIFNKMDEYGPLFENARRRRNGAGQVGKGNATTGTHDSPTA
ncbi:BQ5605_C024g09911 [Microbotryum silenes-dioicae]|uniref:BQ5605_C024g09911 protein n=1 Tax=Microbotryum silenes-dioicae TaxID=796604 RepID=A0A2X0PLE9_9BASI|nr:BQ5605_C024g09911 [Microbotryum silenes-dioicae]